MSRIDYTPDQRAAFETRGGATLVSAAAGSGKTRVLVERIMGYITGKSESCNVDDFLVITYTRAAAAELRTKIIAELTERLAHEPSNRRLRRQITLCAGAKISTIHGFCVDILRENMHTLDISPDFRVADEAESLLIKTTAVDRLLNRKYGEMSDGDDFSRLVDTMSAGRDDKRLSDIILEMHEKLQSHLYPEKWVKEQLEALSFDGVGDLSETVWGRYLTGSSKRAAEHWLGVMEKALGDMAEYGDLYKAYGASFIDTAESIRGFIKALEEGWDAANKYGRIKFPTGRIKGYEEFKAIRKRCKAAMDSVTAVFENSTSEHIEDMMSTAPVIRELMNVTLEFDREYSGEKRKKGVIDFADQEHLTVKLLYDESTGEKTKLAGEIASRFTEIMIDEYQDVNAVQEKIFSAVSREGRNIFMVGDVKQSIYRFRLADPTIFMKKYNEFRDVSEAAEGEARKIILPDNFRSRKGILSAVNFIFRNIMSEEFGEMDYTEREFLKCGRKDEDSGEPAVEVDILTRSSPDEEEALLGKTESEAEFVADRIAKLLHDGMIIDDGGIKRRVSPGDFAVLLRSVKDKAWKYAAALEARGIPVAASGGGDFFDTPEIAVMISILAVIDNPRQDIPLISVLRSPVFGFTASELAEIRVLDRESDFYTALKKSAEENEKSAGFLKRLNDFRNAAPDMTAGRLIWHVFNETGILGIFGAMSGGEKRRANLMTLFELAHMFESSGYKGNFGFTSYLRRLMEKSRIQVEVPQQIESDAVSIMSIHKSKGLEFPVVILADTAKKLNLKDASRPLLIHSELGVGAMCRNLQKKIEYPTVSRMAVSRKIVEEACAEELRVLYVALTRAREKLIIVSTFADAENEISKIAPEVALPVPPQALMSMKNTAQWLLVPTLTRREAACLRGDLPLYMSEPDGESWEINLVKAPSEIISGGRAAVSNTEEQNMENEEEIRRGLEYVYPYEDYTNIPSKLTATELKGRFRDAEVNENAGTAEKKVQRALFDRPEFITGSRTLTRAEKGTALHLVMQYIDYGKCSDKKSIQSEILRIKNMHLITPEQADSVSAGDILKFFASEAGQRVIKADKLYREFKFSILVPASEYYNCGDEGEILMQGVIDCCMEENGELTVIDFKTDYVTEHTMPEKAEGYRMQLEAYSAAMEKITGKRVKSAMLYFFAIGKIFELK